MLITFSLHNNHSYQKHTAMKNKSTILNVRCFVNRKFLCFFFSMLFIMFSAQPPYKSIQKAEVLPQSLQLVKRINHTQKIDAKNKGQFDQSSDVSASSYDGISPLQKMAGKTEDLSKRDAFSKTFQNADGSYTAVIGAGPIHYEKNGKWEDIDTKISKSSIGNYAYSNVANMMESYFGFTSQQGVMSKTKEGEVKEFLNTKMYWEVNGQKVGEILGANVSAQVENDKLFYNNLFGNISAEFTVLTGKRKLNYIIPNKEALGVIPSNAEYLVFSEDIVLPEGWSYEQKGKQVLIYNPGKKIVFLYHAPNNFEKYTKENLLFSKEKPEMQLIVSGERLTYLLKVKVSWLMDAQRIYPIAVDPTISSYPANEDYMSGFCDESGVGGDDTIGIGYWYNDEMDGYVRFDLSAIPAGSTVTATTSGLYRYDAQGTMNNRYYRSIGSSFDPRHWLAYTLLGYFDDYYYLDMFDSYTNNLSGSNSANFNTNNQYKTNTFNATGQTYVQNGLPNGYVNVLFYPSGTSWSPTSGAGNYGVFYGYSAATNRKPYLSVTYAMACTTPSSSTNTRYISNVKFLGTLNPDTNQTSAYSSGGYADFKSLANKAKQIPGGGINVYVNTVSPSGEDPNYIKAWVDWNKDGVFDPLNEIVFNSGSVLTSSTTFGFVVPAATAAGNYNIRIRNYNYDYLYDEYGYYFGPCGARPNGEVEDYTFEVIADCSSKITATNINTTDGHRCGNGSVTLSATGTGTSYQWYTSEFGATAISGATSATYTTPNISATTIYYVTAKNGSCESVKRTPVIARIDPTPVISFTTAEPDICGDVSSVIVTSSGDKEEVTLLDQKFESGLGSFVVSNITNNGTTVNNQTQWQIKNSTFIPTGAVWYPAISSGNHFVYATSDIAPPTSTPYTINTALTSQAFNTADFLNLTLTFDSYYSYFGTSGEGLYIEVSTNGATWITPPVQSYTSNIGIGTRFETKTIDLSAYINQPTLRIRFRYAAQWADGIAIDNVRIFGDKPLSTNFTWTGDPVVFANDCVSTVPSGGAESICIKPTEGQLENEGSWTVNATATLSNGCDATGTITINNNSKTWNTTASSDWASLNWKPDTAIPTDDKCVVIKTPVNISNITNAVAKNITIKSGGKLEIAGNLTVEEKVVNENTGTGAADQFVLLSSTENSNANYLQNSNTPNTSADGVMRAERRVTDMDNVLSGTNAQMDYVYWSAPVAGQDLQAFSPGTPANRIYQYNEPTDLFVKATGNFVPAKGYAIRAETGKPDTPLPSYDKTYNFRGIANNGDIPISIQRTNSSGTTGIGYNLVGNPYPSNIDFDELYYGNSSLIYNTAWFWTNNSYEEHQQGSSYGGNNYAVYNGTGGNAPTTPSGQPAYPDGIIKVGQGFIVQKKTVGSGSLEFKNSYGTGHNLRVTSDGTFFHKGNTPKNRFWIKLIAPEGLVNTQLIGYISGATDGYEQDFDAEAMSLSSDLFYSVLDDKKLVIQGKSDNFNIEDKIPIGANIFKDGNYTIALDKAEGIFETDQNIYLKDNLLETVTNLSEQDYTFVATAGITEGRFEIIYQPENVLATGTDDKDALEVYRDGGDFIVRSSHKRIAALEVYDASGRMVYSTNPFRKETVIPGDLLVNGIYLVKTELEDGQSSVKKIRK